jgi:Carboxypeptidase regulatory-like domain
MPVGRTLFSVVVAAAVILSGISVGGAAFAEAPAAANGTHVVTAPSAHIATSAQTIVGTSSHVVADAPTPIVDGSISGKVVGDDTGTSGLTDIAVQALDSDGDYAGGSTTDDSGEYSIANLAPGTYFLEFLEAGTGTYAEQWWKDALTMGSASTIQVKSGLTASADVSLHPGGSITGTVTGADTHEGVGSVAIDVEDANGNWINSTSSNTDGSYSIGALPPGSYKVQFDGTGTDYIGEWYDNAATEASATPVVVTAGGSPSTADAELAVGGTIVGTVTGAGSSGPITAAYVTVYDSTGNDVGYSDLATPGDGTYSISGLSTGQYYLEVNYYGDANFLLNTWWEGKAPVSSPPITVTAGHTVTVNPELSAGGSISGTVTGSDTHAGLPGIQVSTCADTARIDCEESTEATTDSNGNYTIHGLGTGNVTLLFQDPSGNYAYQYWNGKSLVSQVSPIAVTVGQATPNVNATLVPGSSISGVVSDAVSHDGIAGVEVDEYDSAGNSFESTQTDNSGVYTFNALPAGAYKVKFVPSDTAADGGTYAYQWWQDASTRGSAAPVTLTAGQSVSEIDAALVEAPSISGTVTDATSHLPLTNVEVDAYDASGENVSSTGTFGSAGGQYSISGLAAGSYTLQFTDESSGSSDHAYQWYSAKSTQSSANPVTVGSSNVTANAALTAGGSITGAVSGIPTGGVPHETLYDADGAVVASAYSYLANGAYQFDGLPAGTYRMLLHDDTGTFPDQWYNGGSSLASATPITVTAGQSTSVDLSFSAQLITSATPTITGSAAFGQTLTAVPGAWAPTSVSLAYQWLRDGTAISGATSATYVATAADLTHQLSVAVTGTESGYPPVAQTSASTSTVIPATLTTATPTITGDTTVGKVLTASAGTWGPTPVALSYRWSSSASGPITGATGSTYTPVAGDEGSTLTVTVSGTKTGYATQSLTSAATSAIGVSIHTFTPGTPSIAGTPTAGTTVTVQTGNWSPTPDTFSYQWKRGGVAISGATSASYKLATADNGHPITVTVTASKAGFDTATATSAGITAGKGLTKSPAPTISGTATVGSTLASKAGTWAPATVALHYRWNRNGTAIPGATATKYKLVAADGGTTVSVTVTGSKTGYTSTARTSSGKAVPALLAATPTPTIAGTALVGQVVTAVTGSWAPDGVVLGYQWKRSGKSISHATHPSYTLTRSDAGKAITLTVTGSRAGYHSVAKTSTPVKPPKLLTKFPTPTISGSALVGSTLSAHAGTWAPATVKLGYKWSRNGTAIPGATTSKYKLTTGDGGATVTVTVTGSKSGYAPVSRTSAGKYIPLQLTATPTPTITGTAAVGQLLTAVPGDWAPAGAVLTYRWTRAGATISHATLAGYTLTSSDAGKAIAVIVTGSLAGYQPVSKTSRSVTPPKLLTRSPAPTIRGTLAVGSILSASAGAWAPGTVTLHYQWNRDGIAIPGATASKYSLTSSDPGTAITLTVTGSKTGYAPISRTSLAKTIPTA